MTHVFEVLPSGTPSEVGGAGQIVWPVSPGTAGSITTTLQWGLAEFSAASGSTRDLFRIVAALYLADSLVEKPAVSLHRDLEVHVHVADSARWTEDVLNALVDLARWLTGDRWTVVIHQSAHASDATQVTSLGLDRIQLLSGGLDSLAGAVIGMKDGAAVGFVGARDYSTAVRHAQNLIAGALGADATYRLEELLLADASDRKNHGPRMRSLLFMVMAVLHAENDGAPEVWVPENGFTSINAPLDAGRGGTLTTRSTHPYTFALVNALLDSLSIEVAVVNPFSALTKGELVGQAKTELRSKRWAPVTAASYSCGRGNTQRFHADPNLNCGLCVACVVRRGSFIAAGMRDPSTYACDALSGGHRKDLVEARSRDIYSIREALAGGIPDVAILASGRWPGGTDFDAVIDLVHRGLEELRAVRLPRP
ncbi:7-cyano-7-deazaguanine synthase [Protaetiibacter mangrovi]|uniref:7-cyano-7-deazaguanine synthase n=1 Tax=Protaetiibacter mangrovi TaxID=2970926 RepID=A0ABT1ZGN2_9MICO|nr:7-cyano-7-deazaguanine synthase [Protaetiibacter mangrovi]MCS0499877.1 7-cyano-7-deazaguanine synthase [Protaetiibacter mangrovi]TPX05553.1 hypothetical protein FJ656_05930 [Schumannella luteola]